MCKKSVLIVGGYGEVGKLIAAELVRSEEYRIILAGRDRQKAEQMASQLGDKVKGVGFDVSQIGKNEKEIVKNADMVMMCTDQTNTEFVQYYLAQSKLYFDISANTQFLGQLRQLNGFARHHKSMAVINLGLCPGLSNLFALELMTRHRDADEILTGILLGLGENHGKASIEWTLENYIRNFEYNRNQIWPFVSGRNFYFPAKLGKRKAYRFNFSDQHALKNSYPGYNFSTYLCFDLSFVTWFLHCLRKSGFYRILQLNPLKQLMVGLFSKFSAGKTVYALSTVAIKNKKIIDTLSVSGNQEALLAAKVAATVLRKILTSEIKGGVFDIHSVLSLNDIRQDIQDGLTGISFSE